MILKCRKIFFILIISVFLVTFLICQEDNTIIPLCNSEEPQILIGESVKKILKIPMKGDEYLSGQNCSFLIKSNSKYNGSRILINFDYIDIEEPIFEYCSDVIELYSGDKIDENKSIIKFCGRTTFPLQIISNESSLFFVFLTDDIVQKSGFQMSYEIFNIPGCPPEWIPSNDGKNCFYISSNHFSSLSWIDAQGICEMSISNLMTFEDYNDYQIISEIIDTKNETFWIGYQDFSKEGEITSISGLKNTSTWNIPNMFNDKTKDCMTLTVNNSNINTFNMVECNERHPFICKRSYDKPYTIKYGKYFNLLKRQSFEDSTWIFYIFISITVFFILVLLYCILLFCKQHKRNIQINNYDQNQMLVSDNNNKEEKKSFNSKVENCKTQDVTKTKVKSIKNNVNKEDEEEKYIYGSAKFDMKANQPNFVAHSRTQTPNISNNEIKIVNNSVTKIDGNESLNNSLILDNINLPNSIQNDEKNIENTVVENEEDNLSKASKLNLLGTSEEKSDDTLDNNDKNVDNNDKHELSEKKEDENPVTKISEAAEIDEKDKPGLSLVLDIKKKHFDRPQILRISNASATSLDEFWKNV
ncbi:CUB domain and C-type lectin domain and C-type lectin-like domain and C-type lectin fold domain-containing protein [Strongyloides ratti]|uniref:CUB domain and C-type lectin domain and C-type lectin-like domain and C-type lectin fold domain-containing protein n=1 Tax=Strongyloides ratti TaxID=34506 RepID=A0A090KWJ7_STRRB|nr:CUB domain and C-type lectin domain and C-type lectin-like domain and C-type lectin fold domain-containing protein [Strongyloides ratti]CEF59627.1 CUB domain and C-type lectin domain and C-type lectin-like domain and C-type lectin fold domain-containing protein [Strongyloides ratti]